ncbi:hypothetical protein BDV29DRAFT_129375 [Aspergillus leporis]|uniref:Uncharacterized protein n=1 Tax=Aspergillus leporis TaxID=41062 RepID=A0A5N5XEZ1_9EURO|nr:hypothetical protein BDV29DRAFT_129375 [Aspergillus leporis]
MRKGAPEYSLQPGYSRDSRYAIQSSNYRTRRQTTNPSRERLTISLIMVSCSTNLRRKLSMSFLFRHVCRTTRPLFLSLDYASSRIFRLSKRLHSLIANCAHSVAIVKRCCSSVEGCCWLLCCLIIRVLVSYVPCTISSNSQILGSAP